MNKPLWIFYNVLLVLILPFHIITWLFWIIFTEIEKYIDSIVVEIFDRLYELKKYDYNKENKDGN